MSIFGDSVSIFRDRRAEAIRGCISDFFYASWFLLRMQSEQLTRSPNRIRYHWQRDRYIWRRQGRLRKHRKTFPKSFAKVGSPWKAAYRWHISSVPLTSTL